MRNGNIKIVIRRIIAAISAVIVLSPIFINCVFAKEYGEEIVSGAACVYNIENDKIIFDKNSWLKIYPASTVKIMTAILALEYYRDARDGKITVSEDAVKASSGNVIGLKAGDTVSIRDLIYAVIIGGKNDAANALATSVCGSIKEFVVKMNNKAKEIGAANTVYTNPTGMHNSNMTTTAYDTAKIAAYAYRLQDFAEISDMQSFVFGAAENKEGTRIYNRNLATLPTSPYYYGAATGINAGVTDEAGNCAVCALYDDANNLTYIGVTMKQFSDGNTNTIYAYTEMKKLLIYAKSAYKYVTVLSADKIVGEIPVRFSADADYVLISPEKNVVLFLPNDDDIDSDIKIEYEVYKKRLDAPIEKNEKVGEARIYYQNQLIKRENLVTKININSSFASGFLYNTVKLFKSIVFWIVFIFAAAIVFVYFKYIKPKKIQKTHKNSDKTQ